jgi:hypothetical protein
MEGPGVDRKIILDGSSGSGMWGYGLDRAGSGYGQVSCTCEFGNEPSGSTKCREFISGVPRNFVRGGGGGGQQIPLETEDRGKGGWGAGTA